MIIGNDTELMEKIKHLSTTARISTEYDHDMVGFNYRMTNIQAAVGCAQMERAEEFIQKKREIREFYNHAFAGTGSVSLFPVPAEVRSACWFSGIVLNRDRKREVRKLCQGLKEKGIEGRTFWKPVHLQKPYINAVKADSLKIADSLWERILTLPCSTNITKEKLEYVASSVKELLS